jgi:hypothetical protein
MFDHRLFITTVFAVVGAAGAVLLAPTAAAIPQCTNTGPNTTICSTNGSSQIVTSPAPNNGPWGWPYGGWGIGFGGWGIGW